MARQTLDERHTHTPLTFERFEPPKTRAVRPTQKLVNAINTFQGWHVRGGTSEVVSRVRSVRISRSRVREAGWSGCAAAHGVYVLWHREPCMLTSISRCSPQSRSCYRQSPGLSCRVPDPVLRVFQQSLRPSSLGYSFSCSARSLRAAREHGVLHGFRMAFVPHLRFLEFFS